MQAATELLVMCRCDATCSAEQSICKAMSRGVNGKGKAASNQRVMKTRQVGGVVLARLPPRSLLLLIDLRTIFLSRLCELPAMSSKEAKQQKAREVIDILEEISILLVRNTTFHLSDSITERPRIPLSTGRKSRTVSR